MEDLHGRPSRSSLAINGFEYWEQSLPIALPDTYVTIKQLRKRDIEKLYSYLVLIENFGLTGHQVSNLGYKIQATHWEPSTIWILSI